MEEKLEITENTEKEQKSHLFQKGVSGNPNGRPKGSENFSTKWRAFVEKVAKQNGMTPNEIDEQLLAVGFKKAKEGDYNFYRDLHDRVYGKPLQTIEQEVTQKTYIIKDGDTDINNLDTTSSTETNTGL